MEFKNQNINITDEVTGIAAVDQNKFYTDNHMHMMSKQFSELFKVLNGCDNFNGNLIKEFSAKKILTLLNKAKLDRGFVLSGAYILGMSGIAGTDEYNDVKKKITIWRYSALSIQKIL